MPVDQCGAGPSRRGPPANIGILAYEKDVPVISISQRIIYTASTNQGNLARIDLYAQGSDLVTAREILVLSTRSSFLNLSLDSSHKVTQMPFAKAASPMSNHP